MNITISHNTTQHYAVVFVSVFPSVFQHRTSCKSPGDSFCESSRRKACVNAERHSQSGEMGARFVYAPDNDSIIFLVKRAESREIAGAVFRV